MSRTRRNALIAGFFFIVLPFAVVVDRQMFRPIRQAAATAAWASDDWKRYHGQRFEAVEVVDGDTLDLAAVDGEKSTTRVRLIGVDTPETKHPTVGRMYFGPEATDFTREVAEGQRVTVYLDTVTEERDRYGRLLAYIVLPDGQVLNELLIRGGYGYADLRFRHSRYEKYVQLMEAARKEGAGVWEAVTQEQLPEWLRRERPELLRNVR